MKRLLVHFVFLLTVLYSYTVIAQGMGSLRKSIEISFPEKIQKLVLDPLPAGTYSIGTGGYFATIQSAFEKLSTDGVAGEVILELTDNLYTAPSDSFGFFLNGPIPGAGPTSRVTIKPASNKNVTIEGSGQATVTFLNTKYVTIDGVSLTGPTTLTVHTLVNSQFDWILGVLFHHPSSNNIVRYVTFENENYSKIGIGIGFMSFGVTTLAADSNLIQNNFIKKAGVGIYVSTYNAQARARNNLIRGNIIGSESNGLITWGIQVELNQNSIIENNLLQNINQQFNLSVLTHGINLFACTGCIMRNNVVNNMTSSTLRGSTGILLSGDGSDYGYNNLVYNNMVYDIQSTSTQYDSRVTGIQMWYQINPMIYYNSIYLYGTGTNKYGSSALYVAQYAGMVTNLDAKNNIFVNIRDESPYCASAINNYSAYNITSDYNDLFYEPNQYNCLVRIGSNDYHTLADWQATGQDLNSFTEMPHFVDSYLHIDEMLPTNLERGATPIATITTDFDGDLRSVTTPDIGADEFDGFTFEDPLPAGTYTVGTDGNFATIQEAFDKLSTDGIVGNVTLELIDNLYTAPTDSFGFKLVGPIPGAGENSRVIIKPAENKNVVIEGNGFITLSLTNTSFVTINGVALTGTTTLTIHALKNNSFAYNDGIDFLYDSDHNVMQNIIFIQEDNTRSSGSGFWCPQVSSTAPDSNIIQNNFVKQAGMAFFISAYYSSVRANGNIIRGNKIGSETDSLYCWGIQLEKCQNTIIENNIIQNQKVTRTSGSDIINVGINSYSGIGDVIRNNVVHNIRSTAGYTSVGILLSGGSGSNNMIYNNMVYDIQSTSTQSNSRVAGIQIWLQANPKIYYNTVYLSGNGANHLGSAAFYIYGGWGNSTNVDARNNIFVNTRDESPYCASAIYDYSASNLTTNYNDLFYEPNQYNCIVRAGGTDYLTLADWQVTGQDLNSVTEMPNFVSPDLHIADNSLTLLDGGATPIVGIETDIDGEARNATVPDIGADEFLIVGVEDEISLPTEFALEQNYPNPFNPSTTFRYSIPTQSKVVIKIYDILSNEIATLIDEEKSVGTYELTWNAASLPSGVYFYQLKAGDYVNTKKMILLK